MIGFLAARAITGIEAVDGSKRYRRSPSNTLRHHERGRSS